MPLCCYAHTLISGSKGRKGHGKLAVRLTKIDLDKLAAPLSVLDFKYDFALTLPEIDFHSQQVVSIWMCSQAAFCDISIMHQNAIVSLIDNALDTSLPRLN